MNRFHTMNRFRIIGRVAVIVAGLGGALLGLSASAVPAAVAGTMTRWAAIPRSVPGWPARGLNHAAGFGARLCPPRRAVG